MKTKGGRLVEKRALTEKEIKEIKREYVADELDIVKGMTKEEKQEIFSTLDEKKIEVLLKSGIDGIKTTTEVEEMFGSKYCHIYE